MCVTRPFIWTVWWTHSFWFLINRSVFTHYIEDSTHLDPSLTITFKAPFNSNLVKYCIWNGSAFNPHRRKSSSQRTYRMDSSWTRPKPQFYSACWLVPFTSTWFGWKWQGNPWWMFVDHPCRHCRSSVCIPFGPKNSESQNICTVTLPFCLFEISNQKLRF